MSDAIPCRVVGAVTRHEPYGFYIDFGQEKEGLVIITMVVDDPDLPNPEFPPVGASVETVLLGYADVGGQPRLSSRPMDLAALDG
jgi:predicted RNA-binding protein with RPS1 domain